MSSSYLSYHLLIHVLGHFNYVSVLNITEIYVAGYARMFVIFPCVCVCVCEGAQILYFACHYNIEILFIVHEWRTLVEQLDADISNTRTWLFITQKLS